MFGNEKKITYKDSLQKEISGIKKIASSLPDEIFFVDKDKPEVNWEFFPKLSIQLGELMDKISATADKCRMVNDSFKYISRF